MHADATFHATQLMFRSRVSHRRVAVFPTEGPASFNAKKSQFLLCPARDGGHMGQESGDNAKRAYVTQRSKDAASSRAAEKSTTGVPTSRPHCNSNR
jgi:hypothetical protein